MKKIVKIILILGIVILLYQVLVDLFQKKHQSSYFISTKNNRYQIIEDYEDKRYLFSIKNKNNQEFVYYYPKDLNKQKKVITDIIDYQKKNLSCIAPVINNEVKSMICFLDKKLVSYTYLKQIEDKRVDEFVKKIEKSSNNKNLPWKDENQSIDEKYHTTIYNEIPSNFYITFWNYSRLLILNNQEIKKIELLKKDAYENKFSTLVGKYYITTDTDSSYYNRYYLIDIETGKKETLKIKDEISKKIYFNGSYKNSLYLTDQKEEKQYKINLEKKKIEQINPKYYNGESLVDMDMKSLSLKNKYFKKEKEEKRKEDKFSNYKIEKNKIYHKVGSKKVLLFQLDDFRKLKVVDNYLFFISNDTLYMYQSELGLKKVLQNRELIYNDQNIYDVYIGKEK